MMKFFAPTALVAVALALATPGISDACWRGCGYGYGCGYGCWDCGWQGYGYGYGCCYSYAPYYCYAYPSTYVYPVQTYASTRSVAPTNTASIRVTVPPSAKVWFDDKKTTQIGSERLFESPSLTPGADYGYDIKAQWRDQDGKEVTQTRHVNVSANASVSVDFRPLAAAE
jgi:uncharacterized protein (TIGR03000 family)